ncbi:plasmid transfer protein [Salmonella enterica]|uniref:Plasmid transfer protein n=1 Tax=Salmonella enterica TaxID=28901 RepID=A0A5U3NI59_SALER|nr:plasmid transfer protein [Salmonella enterica]EAX0807053.1 plasmid transfer protein [Salmonella enterica]EAY6505219.1 plasmid transfer protein [Salmonella enterica]EAZ0895922.1 plasmid transfer protein [Salmonella enterica]EBE6470454.1 plasmid transfer protein [Salmonella enterica]
MKVNFKKVIPLLMVGLTVAGSYSIFNAKPSKPDLYDFTGKVLKTTSVFQPCDKESTPSLNIQIADNGSVHINGVASKVTFVERVPGNEIAVKCTGLQVKNSRLVHTSSYTMIISEGKGGFVISDLTHTQDNEVTSGTWFFKKRV